MIFFTQFDKFRLKVLLKHVYKEWNYPYNENFNDYHMMLQLLEYPFLFEKIFFGNDISKYKLQIKTYFSMKLEDNHFNELPKAIKLL